MNQKPLPARRSKWDDFPRVPALLGMVLALVTILLYAPVSHHQFITLDDAAYIADNVHVRTGLSISNVIWAFTDVETFYWQPVTWISHMIDCQLFGVSPGAHHVMGAMLHVLNALLLFTLLRLATGATWRSLAVAAIFAVHPLNVEAVAWAAERKSLLSAMFTFLALLAYLWYVRRPAAGRYAAVAGCFALALMSKPMAVTVPALLLVLDYWPLQRYTDQPERQRWLRLFMEKLPLFVLSAASSAITIFGHRGAIVPLQQEGLLMRIAIPILAYATYLRRIFWPSDLLPLYPVVSHIPWAQLFVSALALSGMTLAALRYRRLGYPLAGWVFYLLALLPVSGIMRAGVTATADRFTYVPAIGILIVVVWAAGDLVEAGRVAPLPATAAALIALTALSVVSRRDLGYWADGLQLWGHERQHLKQPHTLVEMYYGDALLLANRTDEALEAYQRSCSVDSGNDLCHYSAALILHSKKRYAEALQEYQIAFERTKVPYVKLYSLINTGQILLATGDLLGARQDLRFALQMDPNNQDALRLLAQSERW